MRNSASHWLSLSEYIMMHGPLNVKLAEQNACIHSAPRW